ncbi:unnamed protein product [Cylicocyclus nassatus]|uniref:Oxidoreductase-like domain-containing protein n=1 Tax=Cylicocyclus nassatus TaxID=53992 RepID=A0AA36MAI1_CYLNA|nr:unnamed protein product [Cylicocyclus nassatus]
MTIAGQKDDKLVHMVRIYMTENKEETIDWEEEPQEPFPQDCCGQSCRPCVFDIHHEDVVRWAKECAKRIPHEESTLYSHFYHDDCLEDDSIELVFSRSEYRPFELLDVRPLSHDTNLYKFAISHGKPNLPLGSHLRTR